MSGNNASNRDRRRNGNGSGENDEGDVDWWQTGAAVVGAAAVVGGLGALAGYWLTRDSTPEAPQRQPEAPVREQRGFLSNLAEAIREITDVSNASEPVVPSHDRSLLPAQRFQGVQEHSPNITDLNSLLQHIHGHYIALKREDIEFYNKVFTKVVGTLHANMKAVDKYYERYSSNIHFARSANDRLRIRKPDKFEIDLNIVIGVPVNMNSHAQDPGESDIVIEPKWPGYVQLRAGTQYQKILIRDGPDCLINRTAHSWLDDRKFILRSKFTDWFKSVGNRGLNQFQKFNSMPICFVDGVQYTMRTSYSGAAWTIIIESGSFRLDVNLIPTLKFPEDRWLDGNYRQIPEECCTDYWMVVPEPSKSGQTEHDIQRSWRIDLQDQENQMFTDTYLLRQTIQLLKRLRDTQGMNKIAGYYIKTLFFWEIDEKKNTDPTFWHNNIRILFIHMLKKLYEALDNGYIPYYWNKNNNLIRHLNTNTINQYKFKVDAVLNVLENTYDYKSVARYLLTSEEYQKFQRSL